MFPVSVAFKVHRRKLRAQIRVQFTAQVTQNDEKKYPCTYRFPTEPKQISHHNLGPSRRFDFLTVYLLYELILKIPSVGVSKTRTRSRIF